MMLKLRSWILRPIVGLLVGWGLFLNPIAARSATPDPKILHLLNRIGYGPNPAQIEQVQTMGVEAYIQSQLSPKTISLPRQLTRQLGELETLQLNPVELYKGYDRSQQPEANSPEARRRVQERIQKPLRQARKARLLTAIASPRQLQEMMVEFWFDRFNVHAGKGNTRLWVGAYEQDAIRPHALGRFRDLLEATARHPAMLFYLDNWLNTAPESPGARGRFRGLNENYARELMELHSLGVDGGYTQEDVVTLARILTGWGIDRKGQHGNSGFYFDGDRHDYSDKVFLGTSIPGKGVAEVEQALDLLARHPSTARHISYQLAQYFVADDPPASLVDGLAERFLETDGDIRKVLATLFQSPEFWDDRYYGNKFKTPYQYAISALRVTGTQKPKFGRILGWINQLGMPLYGCPTPDGYPNTQDAWLGPDATIRRLSLATAISRGNLGDEEPVNAVQLSQTLGNLFSDNTKAAIETSPEAIRAALILGSPEMMYR